MTDSIDRQSLGAAPDPTDLRALAQDVLESVRAVRERLRVEADELQAERKRLMAAQTELARERGDYELQREGLSKLADELNRKQSDLDTIRPKVEADAQAIIEQTHLLRSKAEQLEKRRVEQAAADADLRRREEALHASEIELQRITKELGPKQQKLDRLEQEIAARAAKLENHAEELVRTRETLAAMQAQLTRDHQEIATQREDLLRRLANLPDSTGGRGPAPEVFEPASANATWQAEPKSAIAGGVDQFRKLRRDAKRRAIGV